MSLDDIQLELFASQHQHFMQLFCSKHLNNAFRFFWKAMVLVYAESLHLVPLCDLDQVLPKEVMAENRGLTLLDLKTRCAEHTSATFTGFESYNDELEPAIVREDADDQPSEIAGSMSPVDPSCVDLKHSAFLAKLLLEEQYLGSTSEQRSPVGKPVLHMQQKCSGEPAAQRSGALARLASNNMPLSEHDAQELRRMLYLNAEGIKRQERLQYLKQTWKFSIWSEEDDRCQTQRYPWCTTYTAGNNVPLNGMTARYLPKLLTSRKKMNMERATSMLRRISTRKMRVGTLTLG